jgi:aminopeptidase N
MRTPTSFASLLALVVFTAPLAADTYPRQPGVDAIHYRFALTLADSSPQISGEATVTLRLIGEAREIVLDLTSKTVEKGMTVTAVSSQGRPVAFTHAANRLRLPVPAEARPGYDLVYTISYGGVAADGLKHLKNLHGEPSVFSDNWPNRVRHWLPTIDHPYDKATGEMIVTAPAHQQVVSNGLLVEEVDLGDGRRRTHWKQSVPIASWLFALGVSRFDVHHAGMVQGVPLQTWVYPQNRDEGREVFEETSRRAMDFFSTRVGPYPYEKLANIQVAGIGGGMELATAIFYGEKGVAGGRAPVVHEIAHQWFGDSVTERDWDDVWLSEGFATYFALLYTEHFEGREAFVQGLQRSRQTVLDLEKKLPNTPVIHRNLDDMSRVLNQFVYQKGGWVLHMLRDEIGDAAFWRGIQEYYRRFRDAHATTDDLRQVMEAAGGRDLRGFFAQWLTRSGVPRVEGRWRYDEARKSVDVSVTQTQPEPPFRMNLEVAIASATGERTIERAVWDSMRQSFSFSASFVPATVTLDPNTTLLAERTQLIREQ